jgi:hypothetical protein
MNQDEEEYQEQLNQLRDDQDGNEDWVWVN